MKLLVLWLIARKENFEIVLIVGFWVIRILFKLPLRICDDFVEIVMILKVIHLIWYRVRNIEDWIWESLEITRNTFLRTCVIKYKTDRSSYSCGRVGYYCLSFIGAGFDFGLGRGFSGFLLNCKSKLRLNLLWGIILLQLSRDQVTQEERWLATGSVRSRRAVGCKVLFTLCPLVLI